MIPYIAFKIIVIGAVLLLIGLLTYDSRAVPKLLCSLMEALGISLLSLVGLAYFNYITWLPFNIW